MIKKNKFYFLQNGSLKVEIPKIRHQSESESGSAVFCRLAGGPDESLNLMVSKRENPKTDQDDRNREK